MRLCKIVSCGLIDWKGKREREREVGNLGRDCCSVTVNIGIVFGIKHWLKC